jgi:hypothetical protein
MASPVAGNHWNNNTIPTPSSTSGLPMTESALLAQDPFSAYVGLLANDANQAKKFLEVASTGQPAGNAELTKLSDGVANTKVLCTTRRTNNNALIHQLELENAMIDSIEGKTIPVDQLLLSQAEIFGSGERPKELTLDYFTKVFRRLGLLVGGHDVNFIAEKMFLRTWEDITALTEEECLETIAFLSNNFFLNNPGCSNNIQHYIDLRVLDREFLKAPAIYGSKRTTLETLRALIGIYFQKLPTGCELYTFTRQYKPGNGEVEDSCWMPKPNAPTNTTAGQQHSTKATAPSSDDKENQKISYF